MDYNIEQQTKKFRETRRTKRWWYRIISVLACITVFCTTYALVIPAITMNGEFYCGLEEHPEHTDECYELVLTCGEAETGDVQESRLICGLDEYQHEHTDACYTESRVLICTDDEHMHTDSCYTVQRELTCTDTGHVHTQECYASGLPDEAGSEPHIHSEECYEKHLICEKELHTHTLQCSSDPEADVESSAVWERTVAGVSLTGDWNKDILAIAETQLGYSESERNYQVDEDGVTIHGYTRYGAWFGDPYGEWGAMFVAFCLRYAGVPESAVPYMQSCGRWADTLSLTNPKNFYNVGDYRPQPGNLVFFDRDDDGYADHVGIVRAYDAVDISLSVIEGNRAGQVGIAFYQNGNADVLGYYALTQNAADEVPEEREISYAELSDMLDALERMVQSDTAAEVQLANDLLMDAADAPALDALSFYRKADVIEQAIETAHDAAAIAETEYVELRNRLNDIRDAFELTASFAANASDGTSVTGLDVVDAPDYIGTVPSSGNSWQITKEAYTGRDRNNKIAVDGDNDGKTDIYIQKNVVQTDTENEFLVYLSMDRKMTMQTFFDNSTFGLTSSKGYNPGDHGSGKIKGNFTAIGAHGETGINEYIIRLTIYQHKGDTAPIYRYVDTRYGSSPNCSNGSFYMVFPGNDNYIILQTGVTLKADGKGQGEIAEANVYLDDINTDFAFAKTVFEQVTDVMGDHIEFLQVVNSDGSATFDPETNTLLWNPEDNADIVAPIETGPPVTGWENNICQLVYRVRLRTEESGFDSCADHLDSKQDSINAGESYAVNKNATLRYHFEPISGATGTASGSLTAAYPVPEVRGTQYNLRFTKVNEFGRELSGALFGVFEEDGTTPVLDSDGNAWTVTTEAGEINGFADLSCGTYVLKELKPPAHYSAGTQSSWTIRLCYTDDQSMTTLTLDEQNLRYSANDSAARKRWEIVNLRGEITYTLSLLKLGRSADGAEKAMSGVEFSISNPDGADAIIEKTDENGTLTINKQFVPGIEYVITELVPPDGYNGLPAPIKFKVVDDKENDSITAELVNEAELAGSVLLQLETDDDGAIVLALSIYNDAGYELPETGGMGNAPVTLFGLAVLLSGVAIETTKLKRRRERRDC